jgi:hypothetical protein
MCKMFGLRWAKQLHGVLWHVHFSNHFGIVRFWGVELWLPTLVSVESMCACLIVGHGLVDDFIMAGYTKLLNVSFLLWFGHSI